MRLEKIQIKILFRALHFLAKRDIKPLQPRFRSHSNAFDIWDFFFTLEA